MAYDCMKTLVQNFHWNKKCLSSCLCIFALQLSSLLTASWDRANCEGWVGGGRIGESRKMGYYGKYNVFLYQ